MMHSYWVHSLYVLGGICLYASMHHFFAGFRPLDRRHLLFSALSFFAGLFEIASATAWESVNVAQMAAALKWQIFIIGGVFSFLILLAMESASQSNRKWGKVLLLLTVVVIGSNFWFPHSIQFEEIYGLKQVPLPFDETIAMPYGRQSGWFYAVSIYGISVPLFALACFIQAYRRDRNGPFLGLALGIMIWIITAIHGILVRNQVIDFIPLGVYGYLVMVIVMSAVLNRDSRNRILASENRFKSIFQQSPLSMVLLSPEGKVRQCNPAFENLWGMSSYAMQGYDLMRDRQLQESGVVSQIQRVLSGKATEIPAFNYNPAENEVLNGPFSDRLIRSFAYPILDKTGAVSEAIIIHDDVTELKRTEMALRESEYRFRMIFEHAPLGLALVDSKSDRYISVNQNYCDIVGLPCKQLMDSSFRDFTHPEDLLVDLDYRAKFKAGQLHGFSMEKRLIKPDGMVTHVHQSLVPLWYEGEKPSFHISVIEDITKRKASEERERLINAQVAHSAKLEAIGHLTSGIAHDFNNILGAIRGYAELTQLVLQKETASAQAVRYLDEVLAASLRAKELIAQMMLFGRRSHEAQDGETPTILLAPVMKEITALLRASLPSTMELDLTCSSDDLQANIQAVQLHQVLMNLGINARDAVEQYGSINFFLTTRHVEDCVCTSCNQRFTGNFVEIAIADSGGGIAPDLIRNIFNPFFTTKEVGKGTGMGLAVVHGIVHAACGHILVDSIPGLGTRFSVLLPAVDNAAPMHPLQLENGKDFDVDKPLSGLRIMVVDDEQTITAMMCELLALKGASVVAFNQSDAALTAFSADPANIDIVITDETMPVLSGMHLARKMLELRPGLPVILCTGYSELATPETVAREGIAAFIYKPVDTPLLIQEIQKLRIAP